MAERWFVEPHVQVRFLPEGLDNVMLKHYRHITLKQYGLQRSGTNYTKFVIESNYLVTVMTNLGGWKHGPYQGPANVDVIVTIKHPLAWFISIWRAEPVRPQFNVWFQRTCRGLCRRWNNMNSHWLNIDAGVRVIPMRYEDLLADPEGETGKYGWGRTSVEFFVPKNKMTMGHETTGETGWPFDPNFYLEERYRKWYRIQEVQFVREHLDQNLLKRFDYEC